MQTGLIELHLHLDGSLNNKWCYEVAKQEGVISKEETFEEFYRILSNTDFDNREEAFIRFDITCDCMQTKKNLHDSIYYLIKDLNEYGLIYAEIRFAPQQHCKKGLTQKEVVEAVLSGLQDAKKDFPNVLCKLINCLMHKGDSALFNDKENRETIEVTKELLGEDLVALDLAGIENNCDFKEYGYLFDIVRQYNIPYTIHAAEMGIGEHIIDALEMKPNRIGHGVNCVQNDEWLKKVVETQIPLEVCVSSNTRGRITSYAKHPVRQLIDAGAYITLNSDNMSLSETDVESEHRRLKRLGVTEEQLMKITYNSIDCAFCSDEEKKMLRAKLDQLFKK